MLAGFAWLLASAPSAFAVPSTATATATTSPSISAMAFNVLYRGADNAKNLDAVARESPDIVCLREIEPGFARAFLDRFEGDYPHRKYRPYRKRPAWGVAIASRYPISEWRVFRERPYIIPAADAVVTVGDAELVVSCVHLIPPMARYRRSEAAWDTIEKNRVLRRRQAKYLLWRYRDEQRPVIMLGDFNEDVDEPALGLLDTKGFKNSCVIEAERCQKTWPAFTIFPAAFRFDHILGRDVSFVSSRVVEAGGSDHYPVVARFTWPLLRATPAPAR